MAQGADAKRAHSVVVSQLEDRLPAIDNSTQVGAGLQQRFETSHASVQVGRRLRGRDEVSTPRAL
jgi:hypothetical protein